MFKPLIACILRNLKVLKVNRHMKLLHTKIPTREIKIPIPYGHIAGKLWGNSDKRPILALHGWQDNAGTWDPLVPLILKDRAILAIDFPGHGLSSWIPPGLVYHQWEMLRVILFIKEYYKWEKVSLLAHSMGANSAMYFASLFPDDVDLFIAMDGIINVDYKFSFSVNKYALLLKKLLHVKNEPQLYTQEEIQNKWHLGSNKSVNLESVQYLAERGIKESKQEPNKYYFTRDPRLKYYLFIPDNKEVVQYFISKLKCPTLYVKVIDSPYTSDQFSEEMQNMVKKNNDKCEIHLVPGTHHAHLNAPEKIRPLITNFFQKNE